MKLPNEIFPLQFYPLDYLNGGSTTGNNRSVFLLTGPRSRGILPRQPAINNKMASKPTPKPNPNPNPTLY